MTKKVALYLRSCRRNQQSVDHQRTELEKYAKQKVWRIFKVYEDNGFSGANTERPALQKMLKDAAKGQFSVLVVLDISRLSRSLGDHLTIMDSLKKCGVEFQTAIDTTACGKMLMPLKKLALV